MSDLGRVGVVVSVQDGMAHVRCPRTSSCATGHAGGECPWLRFAGDRAKETLVVAARNPLHASPGQRVEIEIGTGEYYRGLSLVYVIPLVGAVLGLAAGAILGAVLLPAASPSACASVGAGVGAVAALFAVRRMSESFIAHYKVTRIVRRDPADPCGACAGGGPGLPRPDAATDQRRVPAVRP